MQLIKPLNSLKIILYLTYKIKLKISFAIQEFLNKSCYTKPGGLPSPGGYMVQGTSGQGDDFAAMA